MRLVRFVVIIS